MRSGFIGIGARSETPSTYSGVRPAHRPHRHWRQRAHERVGPHVDADALWYRLRRSILDDDGWARWFCKAKEGRVAYRFEVDGQTFYALVGAAANPVTIFIAVGTIEVRKKGPMHKRRKRL